MKSVQHLLQQLRGRGVKLWVEGADLCFDAPRGALTADLRDALRANKAEVTAFLRKAARLAEDRETELGPVPRQPLPDSFIRERPWLAARRARIPGRRFSAMPQSFAQQRMWFLDQLEEHANYNLSEALNLMGPLDAGALNRALDALFRRHEVLRTVFDMRDGEPIQVIDSHRNMRPCLVDLRGLDRDLRLRHAQFLMTTEERAPFDLSRGPLFRVTLLLVTDLQRAALLSMHHIIGDGWSVGVLTRELTALYLAHAHGEPSGLEEAALQYADYADWLQRRLSGKRLEDQIAYWTGQLRGAPDLLTLPTDRPRPPLKSYHGQVAGFFIAPQSTEALREIGKGVQATLFMTVLALYKVLLARYSGQRDISVGFPIANRTRVELEPLIGLFANTLVLRSDLTGAPSFSALVRRVRDTTLGAFDHQEMPFEKLVEALKPARNLSHSPLFQVMVAYQNVPPSDVDQVADRYRESTVRAESMRREEITSRFDMELTIVEMEGGLSCTLQYDVDLFDQATILAMTGHFRNLMHGAIADPARSLEDLPMMDEAERRRALVEWNDTADAFTATPLAHQRIAARAAATPDAIALFETGVADTAPGGPRPARRIAYRALLARSTRLARGLAAHGVGPEAIIPLAMERGGDFLAAMLAVFEAGAAYLPLDPAHPAKRWAAVLAQTGSPLAIADAYWEPALAEAVALLPADQRPRIVRLDRLLAKAAPAMAAAQAGPDNLAYAIFTSGTTGPPKGAMVTHEGMANHLHAKIRDLGLTAGDAVVQNASQSFDISVWQFLAAPWQGGRVIVADPETARDPEALLALTARQRATVLETAPSLLDVMLRELEDRPRPLPALRWLVPTGEALPPDLCRRWLARFPTTPMVNAYGPTECSDDVSHAVIAEPLPPGTANAPIGRPVANTRLYVLDRRLAPTPPGVPGELYAGGRGVGRGYLGRPASTAAVFIPDPFDEAGGGRLYRTGDRVKADRDGELVYLGRRDCQVKIRGFRIELGEIERVLASAPGVGQAAVVAVDGPGRDKRLIAFVAGGAEGDAAGLRAWLRDQLPEYMTPARIVRRDRLPTTPNGKLDRAALVRHAAGAPSDPARDETPPRDHIELQLAAIWEALLGLHPIGVRASFFDLGGHSILAVRLMSEIRRVFDKKLPLAALFRAPSIEGLAALLRSGADTEPASPLVAIQPEGDLPPFFCIHPIGGNVLCYRRLAKLMGARRPFYGLQAAGLDGDTPPLDRIEAMAERYAAAIRERQAEGPYFLGGWSFGGVIAFEIARVLADQGQATGLLALLDTPAPFLGERDENLLPALLLHELRFHYGPRLPIAFEELRDCDREAQIQLAMARASEAGILTSADDAERVRRLLRIYGANFEALSEYRPRPVNVPAALIQPRSTPYADAADAWRGLTRAGLQRCTVAGDHHNMVEGPGAQTLADALNTALDDAAKNATAASPPGSATP